MHKYRSAARGAAWFDSQDDSPTYNPFRGPQRRRKPYRFDVEADDGLCHTASETDLTVTPRYNALPHRQNHTEPATAPSEWGIQSTSYNLISGSPERTEIVVDAPTYQLKVEESGPPATEIEGASPGDVEPEVLPGVDHLDLATTHARRSRRNIFRRSIAHSLLKNNHANIGEKVVEIGRTIAALGYPADKEATVPAVERNALVIDFEKESDRANGDEVSIV